SLLVFTDKPGVLKIIFNTGAKNMRVLFIGGTQFVGLHMVAAALKKGHEVTLFNRGKTNADLFPEAEKLLGDRDGGLDPLKDRMWDVVVDVNGYVPRLVRDTAALLQSSVGQYIFVSTGSVYDMSKMGIYADENAPLEVLENETTEEWMGPAYGGLKVLCENVVMQFYPDNHLILRLGVVAGPNDPTDRLTYWITRVARGGEMIVPGAPDMPIQFIDARDLADFTMLGIEQKLSGIYNTIGNSVSWNHFLNTCKAASRSEVSYTWIDDDQFFRDNLDIRAKKYGAVPMSVPPELAHIWTMKSDKALADGMVFRSVLNTARDVLAWDKTRAADEERVAGLTLEQEKLLLEKWHAGK
ncbi:MAG: NAD-dependent epimerase/dehydratase family protein, partial [Anaerolineaceae bacterium]|nr:NAD-dependent epimerase/dehydratase family protein [Anaerolineaceae bacterium]